MYSREQQSLQQPITSYIADFDELSSRKRKLSLPVRRHKLLEYVVCGPPNSGKTSLINEYLSETEGENDHVFRLKAENKSRLMLYFAVYHQIHKLGGYIERELYNTDGFSVIVADVYRCLLSTLSTGGRLFVVFENVDNFDHIKEFLVPKEFYNHDVRYVVSTSSETVYGKKRVFTKEFLTNKNIVGILNKERMTVLGNVLNLHLQTSREISLNINHASMELFLALMKIGSRFPKDAEFLKLLKECSNPDVTMNRVLHQMTRDTEYENVADVLQFLVLCGSFLVPHILVKTIFGSNKIGVYNDILSKDCKLAVESPTDNLSTSLLVYDIMLKNLKNDREKIPLYRDYIMKIAADLDMKRDEMEILPLNYFTSVMHFVNVVVRMKKPKSDPLLDKTICQLLLHVIRGVRKCKNTTLALEYIEYTRKTCPSILKYECLCTLKIEEFKISAQRGEDDDYASKFQEIREMILKDSPSESIRNALMYTLYKTAFKITLRMKKYPTNHVIETLRALKPTGPEGNKLATWDVFLFLQNNAINSQVWNKAVLLPYMRSTSQICQVVKLAICSYTNNPRGLIDQFLQCCRQLGVRHWKSVNCLLLILRYTCRHTPHHAGITDPYTKKICSMFYNYNFIINIGVMEMLSDELSTLHVIRDMHKIRILRSCIPPMRNHGENLVTSSSMEDYVEERLNNFDGLDVTDDLILRCFCCLLTYDKKYLTAKKIAFRCIETIKNCVRRVEIQQKRKKNQELIDELNLFQERRTMQLPQLSQQQQQQQRQKQWQQQQSLINNHNSLLHRYATSLKKWKSIHASIAILNSVIHYMACNFYFDY